MVKSTRSQFFSIMPLSCFQKISIWLFYFYYAIRFLKCNVPMFVVGLLFFYHSAILQGLDLVTSSKLYFCLVSAMLWTCSLFSLLLGWWTYSFWHQFWNICQRNKNIQKMIICKSVLDHKQGWKHPYVAKPFVALPTDRRTKYLQNRCSFMRGICKKKLERCLN